MEIVVVLLVLVLFAALAVPNVVRMRDAQKQRASYGQVLDLISEARSAAVAENLTYAITWDGAMSEFDIKKEPPDPNSTSTSAIPSPQARPLQTATNISEFDQVKALKVPDPIKADAFRVGINNSDPGSFAIHFYPDGSSDGGGFEMVSGNDIRSIVVDKYGLTTLTTGVLPDPTELVWTAGTYAQKI